MGIFTKLARDIFAPVDAAGNKRGANMGDVQRWGVELETLINAVIATGGKLYTSKAAMDSDLAPAANTPAIVIGDPIADNNGLYVKSGGGGVGSWGKVAGVPGYSFIKADNAGAGTANAIQVTTPNGVSENALIALPIVATNTASPITVVFDGGTALTIKSSAGNDPAVGGLLSGMQIAGYVSGTTFRMLSDQASAAIQAAAEAAQAAAEEWANNVENDPVSIAAGGDGSTTFSAKHWSAKAQEFAADAATSAGAGNFATRTAANAASCASLPDGTPCTMAALRYIVDSSATGTNSCTHDLGVDGLRPLGTAHPDHFGSDSGAIARAMAAEDIVETLEGVTYSLAATVTIASGKTFHQVKGSTIGVDVGFTDATAFDLESDAIYILDGLADGTNLPQPTADWLGVGNPIGNWVQSVGDVNAYRENVQWIGTGTIQNTPSGACWFKYWRNPRIGDFTAKNVQTHTAHAVNAVFDFYTGESGEWGDLSIDGWRLKGLEIDNAISSVATGTIRGKNGVNTGFCTLALGSGSENSGFTGTIILEGGAAPLGGTALKLELGSSWEFGDVIARSPSHVAAILQSVSGCVGRSVTCIEGNAQALFLQSIDGEQVTSDVKVGKVLSRRGFAATNANQMAVGMVLAKDSFFCDGVEIESVTSINDWFGIDLMNGGNTKNIRFGKVRIEGNEQYAILGFAEKLAIDYLFLRPTASSGLGTQCYFANVATAANCVLKLGEVEYANVNAADDVINFDTASAWDGVSIERMHGVGALKLIELETSTKVRKFSIRNVMGIDMSSPDGIHLKLNTDDMYIDAHDIWITNATSQYNFRMDEAAGGNFFGYVEKNTNCGFSLNGSVGRPAGVTPT